MNDFVPFVAATLRDQVVHDLHEENGSLREENRTLGADVRRLRAEGPTWTVLVTGRGGSPVFARGTVSQREILLEQMLHTDPDSEVVVAVTLREEDEGTACRLDLVRDCYLVLKTEPGLGPDVIRRLDGFGSDGRSILIDHLNVNVHEGILRYFFNGNIMFSTIDIQTSLPPDRFDGLVPELAEGGRVQQVLSQLEAGVGGDTPVMFDDVCLRARGLLGIPVQAVETP